MKVSILTRKVAERAENVSQETRQSSLSAIDGGGINQAAFDRFTIAHFAIGVTMGVAGVPRLAALAVAIGWEIVERPLKRNFREAFPSQDSLQNATVDALAMTAGYCAASGGKR